MKGAINKLYILFALIFLLNTGCATVPLASPELDMQAKNRVPSPDKCLIYIYRETTFGSWVLRNIEIDNNYIGALAPTGTYFLVETLPGVHSISKSSAFLDPPIQINISCQAGQIYFIRLGDAKGGSGWKFTQVHESNAREEISSSKLIKVVSLPQSEQVTQVLPASKRATIAVANLTASALTQDEIAPITANLRDALVKTGRFRTVSEEYMKATFSKQQFQKSKQCDKTGCLVEMGKLLEVEKVVGGTIGKSGSMVNISLRLVNVGTGELEWEFQEKIKGKLNDLFPIINSFANKLASKYAIR